MATAARQRSYFGDAADPSTPTADEYLQMLADAPDVSSAWDATQQYFTFSPYENPQDAAAADAAAAKSPLNNLGMPGMGLGTWALIGLAAVFGVLLLVKK